MKLVQTALAQDLGAEQTFIQIYLCARFYWHIRTVYIFGILMTYMYGHQTRQLVLPSPKPVGYDEACLSSSGGVPVPPI